MREFIRCYCCCNSVLADDSIFFLLLFNNSPAASVVCYVAKQLSVVIWDLSTSAAGVLPTGVHHFQSFIFSLFKISSKQVVHADNCRLASSRYTNMTTNLPLKWMSPKRRCDCGVGGGGEALRLSGRSSWFFTWLLHEQHLINLVTNVSSRTRLVDKMMITNSVVVLILAVVVIHQLLVINHSWNVVIFLSFSCI